MNRKAFLALAILGIILVSGCVQRETATDDMNPPINLDISLSDKPYINQPVTLALIADSTVISKTAEMQIFLPEGIELVDGSLKWSGEIPKGEKSLNAVVKVIKAGNYTIRGQLKDEKEGFENNVYIYLRVTDNSAEFSRVPLN